MVLLKKYTSRVNKISLVNKKGVEIMKKLFIIFTLITGFAYSFEFQAGKELVSNGAFKIKGSVLLILQMI